MTRFDNAPRVNSAAGFSARFSDGVDDGVEVGVGAGDNSAEELGETFARLAGDSLNDE